MGKRKPSPRLATTSFKECCYFLVWSKDWELFIYKGNKTSDFPSRKQSMKNDTGF